MIFHKSFLIYSGECYKVYFHAENNNKSKVYEYFEKCDDITQVSLLFLTKRMGDRGKIYDETKFRIEDKKNKVYAFKPRKERFFCFFFVGKSIIITSAYRKKKQKLSKKDLNRAIEIRNKYFDK